MMHFIESIDWPTIAALMVASTIATLLIARAFGAGKDKRP